MKGSNEVAVWLRFTASMGHIQQGQMIGHEERIEASTLQCLSKTLEMSKVEVGVTISAGITPSAGMDADRTHEDAKFELASSCHEELPIQDDPQNRPGRLSLSNNQTC